MTDAAKHEAPGSRPYFPELDGVRAVAALMIMVFHFTLHYWPEHTFGMGQTGVDLFFVLSGFLITTILLQSPHGDWHEIRNFYIRRALRIFPLYYGYLILASILTGGISLWYWIYLENYPIALHGFNAVEPGHFWSLAIEEQFYLVWPFLVLFWPRRRLAWAMWGTIGLAVALRFLLFQTGIDAFYVTFTRLDGLAGGGLLALYMREGRLAGRRILMAVLAALSLFLLAIGWKASQGHVEGWVQGRKFSLLTALYTSLLGVLLTTGKTAVHELLRLRPMRAIGRVSYGMYVFHPAIFFLGTKYLANFPFVLQAIVCFVMTYGVSVVSFYGYEKRFIDMKQRLAPEKGFREVTELDRSVENKIQPNIAH